MLFSCFSSDGIPEGYVNTVGSLAVTGGARLILAAGVSVYMKMHTKGWIDCV